MDLNELAALLDKYPLSSFCLSSYLRWLAARTDTCLNDNDFITALSRRDYKSLHCLESLLVRSREILGLSDTAFRHAFGFSHDLLSVDPEKLHDILAEPILVVNLSEHGFEKIKKLPIFITHQEKRIATADFTAYRSGKKYAIEQKTIRMENKPKPVTGKLSGNANKRNWWSKMFVNNLIIKIEDKNKLLITQLVNTKNHMSCDYGMLALYTRRMGPAALMNIDDYQRELADVTSRYPQIDYIFLKDYHAQIVVYPRLRT